MTPVEPAAAATTTGAAAAPDGIAIDGKVIPPPGAAPLRFPSVSALFRSHGTDAEQGERPALRTADRIWTYAELWLEVRRWATALEELRPSDPGTPFHLGVLSDNTPDYVFALGATALIGATLVGLNPTRVGPELARDASHTDVVAVLAQDHYRPLLADAGVELPLLEAPHGQPGAYEDPEADPEVSTRWLLVLTSGTSSAPKAVICSQRRLLVTGERMRMLLEVERDDVGYLCMPLFHSNALMVGLMPALIAGASVALAPKFSARGWLPDVRRHGVTYWNYTGKPLAYLLATDPRPDDRDNTLTRAYGNEGSSTIVDAFSERFGVKVIDGFGPTEGGIGIMRAPTDPPGALGHSAGKVKVVDEDGNEMAVADLDEHGRVRNVEEAVGEIVNTAGPGPFEGYYGNEEATARATRRGWYWTGDLGYADRDGFVYFAGRAADWIRVDGENFPAGPIETAVNRHPDLVAAAVFGVPDADAGDAVMTAVVVREGAVLDPAEFAAWVDAQPDLGPKARPRFVRLTAELPRTPSQKVLHRQLQREKFRRDQIGNDVLWHRGRGEAAYRVITAADEQALHARFVEQGRERFWDL